VDTSLLAEAVVALGVSMVPFWVALLSFWLRPWSTVPRLPNSSLVALGVLFFLRSVWVGSLSHLNGMVVLWVISFRVFRCCRLGCCSTQ
jgi:hypothetical protein